MRLKQQPLIGHTGQVAASVQDSLCASLATKMCQAASLTDIDSIAQLPAHMTCHQMMS